jgi:hypothetical protein
LATRPEPAIFGLKLQKIIGSSLGGIRILAICAGFAPFIACAQRVDPPAHPPAPGAAVASPIRLAANQRSFVRIHVPARVLVPYVAPARGLPPSTDAELERLRLQSSVSDLAHYLARLSGAVVPVVSDAPTDTERLPILIGELGSARFGPPRLSAPGGQGFRVVVSGAAIGLFGESDLATSYAIYELLDRLGCRWFMPGPLGEDIPRLSVLALPQADDSLAPSTWFRDLRNVDEDFRRRNRLGGLKLAAGHQLERWVSQADREAHPEWRAVVDGKPHPSRLRWNSQELASAVAKAIVGSFAKTGGSTASVSPADGGSFDESSVGSAKADWDPLTNQASLTDELLVIANRVAQSVSREHPDARLGLLVYDRYARPPLREPVHPNLIPVLAPINYCRTHPISDQNCPGAAELRKAVEDWALRSSALAYRSYTFNLAEPSAPYPMLARYSYELPFFFAHKTRYFQPETLPNFETALPALYLGVRLAWNTSQPPGQVLQEIYDRFYGHAGSPVRAYLEYVDRLWTDSREYAGGSLGYPARFAPPAVEGARQLLTTAKVACRTPLESSRVELLDLSLSQFELFMKLMWDVRGGRLSQLDSDAATWASTATELSERYASSSAFGKTSWAKGRGVAGYFFERYLAPIYREGARIAREDSLLTSSPLCVWRWQALPELKLPVASKPNATAQRTTNSCAQTWSSLGLHNYFGSVVYETELELLAEQVTSAKATSLWLTSVDGIAQAWVNGVRVPLKGLPERFDVETHLKGVTFDVSGLLRPGRNVVSVAVQRTRLAEVGGGGIIGPAFLYAAGTPG